MDDVRLHMNALHLAVRIVEIFQEEDEELKYSNTVGACILMGAGVFRRESVLRDEDAEQMGRHQATGLVHPPPRGMHLYFS